MLAATGAAALGFATASAAGAAVQPGASAGHGTAAATSSWKLVNTVRGKNFPNFTAVTATSRHGAWAFESTASSRAIFKPTAWTLTGGQWSRASFPGQPGERVLSASATSPSDVWVVTSSPAGARVLLFNGSTWSVKRTFAHDFPAGIVALSQREAWAFAGGGAWHFSAGHWSLVKSAHGLGDGSALSPDNVWATGLTSVAHWDGNTWTRTSVKALLPPGTKFSHPDLASIYAQSPSSVWAVGTQGQESQGGPVVVLHYNGHRWARAALAKVCCGFPGQAIPDGSGGLWVPYGLMWNSHTMLHYTGGHMYKVTLPVPGGMFLTLGSAAAVPGTPRAIAVGGLWPIHGTTEGFTRAVIYAYGS